MEENITEFIDSLTETVTPENLENVLKLKEHIGSLNDEITRMTTDIAEMQNTIVAKEELIKKYEKLVSDYVKETPVSTANNTTDTISDYNDLY